MEGAPMYLAYMSAIGEALRKDCPLDWSGSYADLKVIAKQGLFAVETALKHPAIGAPQCYRLIVTAGIWRGRTVPAMLMELDATVTLEGAKAFAGFAANILESEALFLGAYGPVGLDETRITEIPGFCGLPVGYPFGSDAGMCRFGDFLERHYRSMPIYAFMWKGILFAPRFPESAGEALIERCVREFDEQDSGRKHVAGPLEIRHSERHGWYSLATPHCDPRGERRMSSCLLRME